MHEDAEDGDDADGVHELRSVLTAGLVGAKEVGARHERGEWMIFWGE